MRADAVTNVDLVKPAIEKLTPVECAGLQHWLEQQNTTEVSPPFETRPYDPAPARENVRGWIAQALICILGGTILVSFVFLWLHADKSKELHDFLAVIFGPLVALVGAATGYYFGASSNKSR